MTQKDQSKHNQNPQTAGNKRPNETGSVSVEGFVKIFDPKSKEVFVEKRA